MTAFDLLNVINRLSEEELKSKVLYSSDESMIIEFVTVEEDCLDFRFFSSDDY